MPQERQPPLPAIAFDLLAVAGNAAAGNQSPSGGG